MVRIPPLSAIDRNLYEYVHLYLVLLHAIVLVACEVEPFKRSGNGQDRLPNLPCSYIAMPKPSRDPFA